MLATAGNANFATDVEAICLGPHLHDGIPTRPRHSAIEYMVILNNASPLGGNQSPFNYFGYRLN